MCKFNPKNDSRRIDPCMRPLIKWMKEMMDYDVVMCCCGHSVYNMTIVVKFMHNGVPYFEEVLSGKRLERKRKFYKKDKQGYYYIPEVTKNG